MKTRKGNLTKDYSLLENIKYMFKNILDFDKKGFFFYLLTIPLYITLPLVTGLITKIMIDSIVAEVSELQMILLICGITFLMGAIKWLEPILYEKNKNISNNLNTKYKIMAFSKLMSINYESLENIEIRKNYEKARLFVEDIGWSSREFNRNFVGLLMQFIGIFSYIVIIGTTMPWLIVAFAIGGVILFIISNKIFAATLRLEAVEIDLDHKNNYLFRTSTDLPAGKDIRIFSFNKILTKFMGLLHANYKKQLKVTTKVYLRLNALLATLSLCIEGLTLYFLLANPTMSISNVVFYFGVATGFWLWIIQLSRNIQNLKRIAEHANSYRKFLQMEDAHKGQMFIDNIDTSNLTIQFIDVNFTYNSATQPTLKNINFTVKSGDAFAIVGRNGAGKTTCIKLLAGLYKPTSGQILINGMDITQLDGEDYFKLMSVIFQDNVILPMTIAENIALKEMSEIDQQKLELVIEKADLKNKIDKLPNGINSKMVKKIHESAIDLSGGEKQKLLLARALYKDSPILILDEPTAALDPIAENEMYEQYNKYSSGRISFFISHRLASTRFCNKILFFKDGEIVEEGNHDQLMALGSEYAKMFEIQSFYYRKSEQYDLQEGE